MNTSRLFAISVCLVLLCVLSVPTAKADEWSQATKLTFSQSVEVPGRVLGPGTYWFALLDDRANRNVVQIWSEDRTHLIATVLANPDYRMEPTGQTVIKFVERASDRPEAIQAWFFPGDQWGHEFVYPKTEGYQVAEKVQTAETSIHEEASVREDTIVETTTANPPPETAVNNTTPVSEGIVMAESTQSETLQASASNPGDLPQTASRLPLWGLIGLLSLSTAFILSRIVGAG